VKRSITLRSLIGKAEIKQSGKEQSGWLMDQDTKDSRKKIKQTLNSRHQNHTCSPTTLKIEQKEFTWGSMLWMKEIIIMTNHIAEEQFQNQFVCFAIKVKD